MSLKKLPQINAKAPHGVSFDAPSDAMARWDAAVAAANTDSATITMYDAIGEDPWSDGGVTAKKVAAALRSIGDRQVTVSINSPGGDFFEGIAIYNLLREHPYKVTVKVVGLAASAASIIAMAGDEIQVARSGFLMIHNAWAVVIGNRNDLTEAAGVMAGFDEAMADLYAQAAGITKEEAARLMDEETWLNGQEAVDAGFATALLPADEVVEESASDGRSKAAIRKVETLLAKQGMPRSERRDLLRQIKGTPSAAHVTPSADIIEDIKSLTQTYRGH